ncbi:hypothetical protein RJZ56_006549 [Blastomyces dermatitidis]
MSIVPRSSKCGIHIEGTRPSLVDLSTRSPDGLGVSSIFKDQIYLVGQAMIIKQSIVPVFSILSTNSLQFLVHLSKKMSDQCSLKPEPPENPKKRKSTDNLHSQVKKAPPIGTSLLNPVQATPSRDKSAPEDVISVENKAQMGSSGGSIFKSPWARAAAIAAVKSILCCWVPDGSLIPEEDIGGWCDGFSTAEITGLSVLRWQFGFDKAGQDDFRSFMSSFPDDGVEWLRDVGRENECRQDWSFETFEEFEKMLREAKVCIS